MKVNEVSPLTKTNGDDEGPLEGGESVTEMINKGQNMDSYIEELVRHLDEKVKTYDPAKAGEEVSEFNDKNGSLSFR